MALAAPIFGFATKSTAPSSIALNAASDPRSVSVETITTGIGRNRINLSRKSRPSIRGISISSVRTSGFRLRIISRAMSGSGAAPTASMSGCRLMISEITLRISAESSMTSTRILPISTSAKKLHFAGGFGDKARTIVALPLEDRVVCKRSKALDADATVLNELINLPRLRAPQIACDDRYLLGLEIRNHERGVAFCDIPCTQRTQDVTAAENLRFQSAAARAELQQLVYEQLHREAAITSGRRGDSAFRGALRQHEVVHPRDVE